MPSPGRRCGSCAPVAVIGASEDPTRIGGRPLRYLKESGFRGAVWPVNPRRDRVQGLEARPHVNEVPGPIDVAVVAVAASKVLETIEACAAKGVGAAVVFTSGFAAAHAEVVESVDVNPFVVLPEGEGGLAVDALIVERTATT